MPTSKIKTKGTPAKTKAKPEIIAIVDGKIHYIGYPCRVESKAVNKNVTLATSSDPSFVTCKNCIRICLRIAEAWKSKIPKRYQPNTGQS